jgi:MoaA/NifB/PqqE/SkfB family radical SAM enzyme
MDQKAQKLRELILDNAATRSRDLTLELGLTMDELCTIYKKIKGTLPPLPDKPFGASGIIQRIMERDAVTDIARVEAFRTEGYIFPANIELHLGLSCQCACRFCWRWSNGQWRSDDNGLYHPWPPQHLSWEDSRKKGQAVPIRSPEGALSLEDVRRLLDEFHANKGQRLFFSGGLEFFTNPIAVDVVDIVSAYVPRIPLNVYTNGVAQCFDRVDFLDVLVRAAESIRISIHANAGSTYAYTQMPHREARAAADEFARVRRRLAKLAERKRAAGSDRPRIGIAFLVIGPNVEELEGAIAWAQETGLDDFDIRVDMREKEKWFTTEQDRRFRSIITTIRKKSRAGVYLPMRVNARVDETDKIMRKISHKMASKCYIPMRKPAVDPWGRVFACCYRAHPSLQDEDFYLGRLPDQSLSAIIENSCRQGRIPRKHHCAYCTDWELCYNKCVEKLVGDWDDGIPPERQPFS